MNFKLLVSALSLLCFTQAQAQSIPLFSATGAVNADKWYVSSGWSDGDWMACWWKPAQIVQDGHALKFLISSNADFKGTYNDIPAGKYACGELQSHSSQNYGLYQVRMKTAAGSGLNSAFFTYTGSPSHDEIDLEFLGLHPTQVSINYWVNGVSAMLKPIELGFDASKDFHVYAFDWQPTAITWFVDGKRVFQTKPGAKLPANPGKMYLELWAGAQAENGWLGAFKYTAPVSAEFLAVSYTPSASARVEAGK